MTSGLTMAGGRKGVGRSYSHQRRIEAGVTTAVIVKVSLTATLKLCCTWSLRYSWYYPLGWH
jgi:hypothetical protein